MNAPYNYQQLTSSAQQCSVGLSNEGPFPSQGSSMGVIFHRLQQKGSVMQILDKGYHLLRNLHKTTVHADER